MIFQRARDLIARCARETTTPRGYWPRLAGRSRWGLGAGLLLAAVQSAAGSEAANFFEAKIRPLLIEKCFECHSSGKAQKGGLSLDAKPGWERGGDSGAAIVPGQPDESLLIKAVRYTDPGLQMPPEKAGGKLSEAQIADLERWVRDGAFDPRTASAAPAPENRWEQLFAERRKWWSLQPVATVEPPPVQDAEWAANPVDRFVRDRLAREGLPPAPPADPNTLIRRASLVLTGLPPAPPDVEEFVAAWRADAKGAVANMVDRLMASPHFGERFARHWLDVVRFTETHGNEWNYDVPYAWRYRDYIIRAFNDDVPYDQFLREHIAGDLLAAPRVNEAGRFNESAIGTAFYRFGEVNHDSCVDFSVIGYDVVDNQLDTLTKAFQATTVACARCHDHKMDAVSTEDYHAMLAVLRSTRSVMRTLDTPEVNRDALNALRDQKTELRAELARIWRGEAKTIDAAKLRAVAATAREKAKDKPPGLESPWHAWMVAGDSGTNDVAGEWSKVAAAHARELVERAEFNRTNFTTVADFRHGMPEGWFTDGMGLRGGASQRSDFVPAHEGEAALKAILPTGLFTFAESDRLNGALRSSELVRAHGKVSFEVIGGRFSLARLVFNNCQFNYTQQHSIHHDQWSWITINFPTNTQGLHPFAELLTYWDNPKFPDPLGTLGKDVENQREPYDTYAKNPRTWWGLRRVVTHDGTATPRDEFTWLSRLLVGAAPATAEEAAARYAAIASEVVEHFAANHATDDDTRWLDWLTRTGLLSNKAAASPRLAELTGRYRAVENGLALPTTMPAMADEAAPFAQPLLLRGDHTKPGKPIPPGYLAALTPDGFAMSAGGSGRADLARLLLSPDNPLTARVMVNRLWQWVFGRGLVDTPDDFGHLGGQPSHAELLDYLAAQFMRDGWSMKRFIRSLVTSRAFQSAGRPTDEAQRRDPENVLLSHYPARRAEAEVIRDSLLAASGRLEPRMFGPSVHPFREKADTEKRLYTGPLDGAGRRSIYLKFQLMEAPSFLRVFNLPGGKVTQGRREASNTPAQSLALLNDPFVLAMADHWAARLVADGCASLPARIDSLFRTAFGRSPTVMERERFEAGIRGFAAAHGLAGTPGLREEDLLASRAVWKDAAHAIFNLKEFIFIP